MTDPDPSTKDNHDQLHTLRTGLVRIKYKAPTRRRKAELRTYRRGSRGRWVLTFEIHGDIRIATIEHLHDQEWILVKLRGDYEVPPVFPDVETPNDISVLEGEPPCPCPTFKF